MPVQVTCPKCRSLTRVSRKTPAGKGLLCPRCRALFLMPALPTGHAPSPRRSLVGRSSRRNQRPKRRHLTPFAIGFVLGLGILVAAFSSWKIARKHRADAPEDHKTVQVASVASHEINKQPPGPLTAASQSNTGQQSRQTKVDKSPPIPERPSVVSLEKLPVMSGEEEELLRLVNKVRAEHGKKLRPLAPNPRLFAIARVKAASLSKLKTLTADFDGKSVATRVVEAGYKPVTNRVAANLVAHKDLSPQQACAAWVENLATRQLLLGAFEDTGIGIVRDEQGDVYYCQIYAVPVQPRQ